MEFVTQYTDFVNTLVQLLLLMMGYVRNQFDERDVVKGMALVRLELASGAKERGHCISSHMECIRRAKCIMPYAWWTYAMSSGR